MKFRKGPSQGTGGMNPRGKIFLETTRRPKMKLLSWGSGENFTQKLYIYTRLEKDGRYTKSNANPAYGAILEGLFIKDNANLAYNSILEGLYIKDTPIQLITLYWNGLTEEEKCRKLQKPCVYKVNEHCTTPARVENFQTKISYFSFPALKKSTIVHSTVSMILKV